MFTYLFLFLNKISMLWVVSKIHKMFKIIIMWLERETETWGEGGWQQQRTKAVMAECSMHHGLHEYPQFILAYGLPLYLQQGKQLL